MRKWRPLKLWIHGAEWRKLPKTAKNGTHFPSEMFRKSLLNEMTVSPGTSPNGSDVWFRRYIWVENERSGMRSIFFWRKKKKSILAGSGERGVGHMLYINVEVCDHFLFTLNMHYWGQRPCVHRPCDAPKGWFADLRLSVINCVASSCVCHDVGTHWHNGAI